MASIEAESQVTERAAAARRKRDYPRRALARRKIAASAPSNAGCALQHLGPCLCDPGAGADCTSTPRATPNGRRELKKLAQQQVDMLSRYSFLAGGWGYYDFESGTQVPGDASNSFVTATVLIALHEAKSIGIDFPERLTKKAIASIHRQQYPDFTYAYGEYLELCRCT